MRERYRAGTGALHGAEDICLHLLLPRLQGARTVLAGRARGGPLEYRALTGKHSRFNKMAFASNWAELVHSGNRFPSTTSCVGLGRIFSRWQWARLSHVVDWTWRVDRSPRSKVRLLRMSNTLRRDDHALDARVHGGLPVPVPGKRVPIPIIAA